MKTQKHKGLAIILALAAFALAAVRSEAQVLTLIPTEVISNKTMTISADSNNNPVGLVALTFQTSSMPPKARITGVALVMNCERTLTEAYQDIDVFVGADGPLTSVAVETLFNNLITAPWVPDDIPKKHKLQLLSSASLDSTFKTGAAKWRPVTENWKLLDGPRGFTLIIGTAGGNKGRKWYGLSEQDTNLQPRLIIEYTTKNQPAVAQPVSVQSAKSFLSPPPNTPNPQRTYRTLDVLTSGAWSYAPAFRGDFVYLMTDENSKKFLSWRRPLGAINGQPIELSSDDDPGQHLLVAESGHLYVVGKEKIIPFQIGADGTPKKTTTVRVNGLNPDALHAPTLGADGSMFYVSGSSAEGWIVVGRNPDLQELWKVPVGKREPSRVTIGPSGQYVYLTIADDGLVTIDARTGEKFKNPLPNQQQLSGGAPFLHAPVVIRNPGDGIEKVYVAARSTDKGVLTLFDNAKTKTRAAADGDDAKWEEAVAAATVAMPRQCSVTIAKNCWKQLDGLVGQPLVGTDNKGVQRVYVVRVKDGTAEIVSLDWFTGALNQRTTSTFTVGKDGAYLLNGGNLATDRDGNIFVWNGDSETHFKGFTPSLVTLFNDQLVGPQSESNLFFGTDGTLYVGAIGANANQRAIVPQYKLDAQSAADISSPTHLRVDGTVNKKTTLSAGGSVIVSGEFKVNTQTTLKISTGVSPD